jgi:hypothetical protein
MDEDSIQSRQRGSVFGTVLVRVVAPAWVLLGGAMKWWNASPEQLPGWIRAQLDARLPAEFYYEWWRGLLTGIITAELVAVVVMIFFGFAARWVALAILGVFAIVAAVEVFHHADVAGMSFIDAALSGDCGCFGGAVPLPVGVVALIDLTLFGLIATSRDRRRPLRDTPTPIGILGVLALAVAAAVGLNPRIPEHHAGEKVSARYSPHMWGGWKFEETGLYEWLKGSVDPATFGGGPQTWILYRESCPTCHQIFLDRYSEPMPDRVVVAVRIVPAPDEHLNTESGPVTCPSCQFVDLDAGLGRKYNIPAPMIFDIDENGVITRIENPLLHGQPTVDETGQFRHGTEEMQEAWREELKDQ